jgi:hypothetical protein
MKCTFIFLNKWYVYLFSASSCATIVASASSLNGDIKDWGPQLTLDGKIAQGDTGYLHSEHDELQPWLQIAFPHERTISSVEITNR